MLLVIFDALLTRFLKRHVFSPGEMITIYAMSTVASSIGGHDMMQILMPILSYGTWSATPENEWVELFDKYIPRWAAVTDRKFLVDYYHGENILYTWEHVKVWLTPVFWWSAFIFALVLVMLCVNLLMRRQWTEHKKLTYPIIQLSLGMTTPGISNLFRQKLIWIGFAIAAIIDIVNGLHFLYPVIPSLGGKLYNLAPLFSSSPAISGMDFAILIQLKKD